MKDSHHTAMSFGLMGCSFVLVFTVWMGSKGSEFDPPQKHPWAQDMVQPNENSLASTSPWSRLWPILAGVAMASQFAFLIAFGQSSPKSPSMKWRFFFWIATLGFLAAIALAIFGAFSSKWRLPSTLWLLTAVWGFPLLYALGLTRKSSGWIDEEAWAVLQEGRRTPPPRENPGESS